MPIISNAFFLFILAGLLLYYLLPRKAQMPVLLVMNLLFYLSYGVRALGFLLFSICVTYAAGKWIGKLQSGVSREDRDAAEIANRKCRRILILAMLLNFGVLGVLKYTNFVFGNLNALGLFSLPHLDFLLPLGISYYTFQSVGYLLDVYWKRIPAEESFLRLALFVSFFPYMVQGPISRYGTLAHQLYGPHDFRWNHIRYGVLRILWGLFKKMVLADWAAVYADQIFARPDQYAGIAGFGVLLYTVELYGNFSGGIDIMIGTARMFGITMDENFKRPFFSVSVTDFWRRWHITLGTWMKDYVMYPLTMSGAMKKLGKKSKKVFGKKTGRNVPIALSNLIVFFLVGVWHGPTWGNIGWGLYNGVIIAFSIFAENRYRQLKKKLHINDKSRGWHVFMVLRTFALMNLSWYFDCVDSLQTALKMIRYSVTQFDPSVFLTVSAGKQGAAYTPVALVILLTGCVCLFAVSFLQEKGVDFHRVIARQPVMIQVTVCFVLLMAALMLGPMSAGRGFIYAQF